MNDPFAVLGLTPSASEDEIKSAYRKLAKKYHPDLNPGDKSAEEKMRQVNEAYTKALQFKKTGSYGDSSGYRQSPYGSSGNGPYGGSYNGSYGSSYGGQGGYGSSYGTGGQGSYQQQSANPFDDFFGPFGFGFGQQQRTEFKRRNYAHPDLETAAENILSKHYAEAINLLNRVSVHDADWHALYARADFALGNRISALDHARRAVRMAPQDQEYQLLLSQIESGRQEYRQTQSSRQDFRSVICGNPCLTCCAANMVLNCCLGGFRFGMCC